MTPILEVQKLVKQYGRLTAVDGVDFAIPHGICFGLLGPNGAGKTTTLEIIEGIISRTSGRILHYGKAPTRDFHQKIGIQFQATSLLAFLSVRETLETFRNLYREPVPLEDVIKACRLDDILDRKNDKISGGQRQRLLLALSLVNGPDLVFLDEPTTGLDPQARRHVWEIIEDIKAQNKTLVLTTHYMEEAQMLCDDIAIMDSGKIIARGGPEDLIRLHCSGSVITLPKAAGADVVQQVNTDDRDDQLCRAVTRNGKTEIFTDNVNETMQLLVQSRADLSEMTVRTQTLEDLFLKLTGKQLRE